MLVVATVFSLGLVVLPQRMAVVALVVGAQPPRTPRPWTLTRELGVLKEAQAAELARVLQEQREALEIASQKAINAEKAKAFEEKQKIEEKLEQVQRQLQKKTADELGEGAEVDLYEALRAEFPADKITRVKKGEAGADIVHRVMENARESGVILYDSKNRGVWRNDYVSKLRDDQIAEKADIAILATRVFPAGVRQLHIQDGVIITNPARALALVSIIRRHIVQIHALRLSNEARDEKMVRLYDFISSERCSVLFEQMETLADDLLDLDVKEQKAHSSVWNRRGMLIKSLQRAESQLSLELDQILGHQSHDTVAAV